MPCRRGRVHRVTMMRVAGVRGGVRRVGMVVSVVVASVVAKQSVTHIQYVPTILIGQPSSFYFSRMVFHG